MRWDWTATGSPRLLKGWGGGQELVVSVSFSFFFFFVVVVVVIIGQRLAVQEPAHRRLRKEAAGVGSARGALVFNLC